MARNRPAFRCFGHLHPVAAPPLASSVAPNPVRRTRIDGRDGESLGRGCPARWLATAPRADWAGTGGSKRAFGSCQRSSERADGRLRRWEGGRVGLKREP